MTVEQPSRPTPGSSPGTIYLLRHGAIQLPGDGKRYIGWQDLALNPAGLEQAQAWAHFFAAAGLEKIWSSDLSRCRQTTAIIAARCGLVPQDLPELREVSMGSWEGRRFESVKTLYPQAFLQRGRRIADHRPPGGESFRDLQLRAWPVFERAAREVRSRMLIVTHAGVIRVLLCRLLGMPLENLFAIGQELGALTTIEVRPAGLRVRALNHTLP
jgi:probable phosphoglycerate mutase